jgi:serine/threonine protein kinase
MWSLGCVLVEMHMGQPLFPGKCSHDQMGKIIEILGLPPSEMVTKAPSKQRRQFFEVIGETEEKVEYRFRPLPATKSKARKGAEGSSIGSADLSELNPVVVVPRGKHLHVLLGRDAGGPGGRRRGEPNHSPHDYAQFIDLLKKMLAYDPEKRITPLQALRHPFLARNPSTTTLARNPKHFPRLRLQQEAPRHRSLHPTPPSDELDEDAMLQLAMELSMQSDRPTEHATPVPVQPAAMDTAEEVEAVTPVKKLEFKEATPPAVRNPTPFPHRLPHLQPHRPSHSPPRRPRPPPLLIPKCRGTRRVQQIAQGVDIGEKELGIPLHSIGN